MRAITRLLRELLLLAVVILIMGATFQMAYRHFYRAAYPVEYRQVVYRESVDQAVPPSLVFAVIRTESGFDPGARSHVEARGLMQITEETFEWAQFRIGEDEELHFDDLFETELNIRYGTVILRLLLEEFGTVENALCAYHAGWGRAKEWLADPAVSPDGVHIQNIPSSATGHYVDKVMEAKEMYQTLYDFV